MHSRLGRRPVRCAASSNTRSATSAQTASSAPARWNRPSRARSPSSLRSTVLHRHRGDVGGQGRAAPLVGDDGDLVSLGRQASHGLDEVRAEGAEHPRCPKDGRGATRALHRLLACRLAGAVDAERAAGIGLDVGVGLVTVEHVIGGDMHEREGLRRRRQLAISATASRLRRKAASGSLSALDPPPYRPRR